MSKSLKDKVRELAEEWRRIADLRMQESAYNGSYVGVMDAKDLCNKSDRLFELLKEDSMCEGNEAPIEDIEPTTGRPVSPGMEAQMGVTFPILDHGFIRVVDYMGNDASIVQAARVSYQRGTKAVSDGATLIHYLMRHRHTTPFEACEIQLHVKMPIFVARQWIRHRTASVNEQSARYSILDNEFYVPNQEHLGVQSKDNKQGRGEVLSTEQAETVRDLLTDDAQRAYEHYILLLGELPDTQTDESAARDYLADGIGDGTYSGIARELARMGLSLNFYTSWYWKTNLHNLFHFLSLRADPHAQYEIRVYAEKICEIVKAWCPMAWAAFEDCRLNARTFTGAQMKTLQLLLRSMDDPSIPGTRVLASPGGHTGRPGAVSKRDWDEMLALFPDWEDCW